MDISDILILGNSYRFKKVKLLSIHRIAFGHVSKFFSSSTGCFNEVIFVSYSIQELRRQKDNKLNGKNKSNIKYEKCKIHALNFFLFKSQRVD